EVRFQPSILTPPPTPCYFRWKRRRFVTELFREHTVAEQPGGAKRCPVCGRKALPRQSRCLYCDTNLNEPTFAAAPGTDEWLKEVGARLRAAWQSQPRPRIEDILLACPRPYQAELLHNLLGIELELRWQAGDRPTFEEYAARFPKDVRLVQVVF